MAITALGIAMPIFGFGLLIMVLLYVYKTKKIEKYLAEHEDQYLVSDEYKFGMMIVGLFLLSLTLLIYFKIELERGVSSTLASYVWLFYDMLVYKIATIIFTVLSSILVSVGAKELLKIEYGDKEEA